MLRFKDSCSDTDMENSHQIIDVAKKPQKL